MFLRLSIAIAAAFLVSGCSVSQEDWNDESAQATCKFSKKCAAEDFWATHDDMGACIDTTLASLAEADEFYSTCVYDQSAAKECLKALDTSCKNAGANFDELFAPCELVYDCGGDEGT